jgi:hypothetical protein
MVGQQLCFWMAGYVLWNFWRSNCAVEKFISDNGKFRVLIAPDPSEAPWPKQLSIGSGAQTILLLNTVPVWFELWRTTLNGFLLTIMKYLPMYQKSKEKNNEIPNFIIIIIIRWTSYAQQIADETKLGQQMEFI